MLSATLLEAAMLRLREIIAALLSLSIVIAPVLGAPAATLGTIVSADRAHVGATPASVGTTIFSGDKIATEQTGSVQVRAGAARLLLTGASLATFADEHGAPSAHLLAGTAVFSTANAKAFTLCAAAAEIRSQTDAPTVAQVTLVNAKQLIVRSTRGPLAITVDGETQVIPEASAYRVILDPEETPEATPEAQGPRGAGTRGVGRPPRKAARSRFLLVALAVTGVVTYFAVDEALESPLKP